MPQKSSLQSTYAKLRDRKNSFVSTSECNTVLSTIFRCEKNSISLAHHTNVQERIYSDVRILLEMQRLNNWQTSSSLIRYHTVSSMYATEGIQGCIILCCHVQALIGTEADSDHLSYVASSVLSELRGKCTRHLKSRFFQDPRSRWACDSVKPSPLLTPALSEVWELQSLLELSPWQLR